MFDKMLQKIREELPPIDEKNWGGMYHDIENIFGRNVDKLIKIKMKKNNETCVLEISSDKNYKSLQDLKAYARSIWDNIYYHCFQISTSKRHSKKYVVLEGLTTNMNHYYFHCIIKVTCPNFNKLVAEYNEKFGKKRRRAAAADNDDETSKVLWQIFGGKVN